MLLKQSTELYRKIIKKSQVTQKLWFKIIKNKKAFFKTFKNLFFKNRLHKSTNTLMWCHVISRKHSLVYQKAKHRKKIFSVTNLLTPQLSLPAEVGKLTIETSTALLFQKKSFCGQITRSVHRDRLHAGHADKKTTQQVLQTCLGSSSMLVFNFRIGKKKKLLQISFYFFSMWCCCQCFYFVLFLRQTLMYACSFKFLFDNISGASQHITLLKNVRSLGGDRGAHL